MVYEKFSLYFKWIDQIVYEIIANIFTQSLLSASFTQLWVGLGYRLDNKLLDHTVDLLSNSIGGYFIICILYIF